MLTIITIALRKTTQKKIHKVDGPAMSRVPTGSKVLISWLLSSVTRTRSDVVIICNKLYIAHRTFRTYTVRVHTVRVCYAIGTRGIRLHA